MESGITITDETKPAAAENENVANTDSAESFQSFIYELFEKNGIFNDLRAYLRGHIVSVLKSAQTGDPPACQKNFMQRLDLKYQALNMLVAEYLMRLEFSYSFSVFVSEIPLANMVFGFAKSLMERAGDNSSDIRFKEADVWSILNYLGVQCDSEHASNIIQMYNNEPQYPLLLCMLKSMPMYKEGVPPRSQSEDSVESTKSYESADMEGTDKKNSAMCSHCVYCKKCQNKNTILKERYRKKKRYLAKNAFKSKRSDSDSFAKSESLVKNIGIVEKSLIQEMFQQMKSVYETEMEMVKVEEQKKVKQSIVTHAVQLQRKRNELEEAYKARELELERSVQQKKKFLWSLARSLRDQHMHLTRAMHNVRAETERLELKEDSLKSQLADAEKILKKRGDEMRSQISSELTILEAHLATMRRERENITRECSELENLKNIQDSTSKVIKHNVETEEVNSHYDLLKHELEILKTYLESSKIQPKCVIERETMTEVKEPTLQSIVALNNTHGHEKGFKNDDFDERVKMNQLVNDFKKKNVNLSQSNHLDEIYERSGDRSRSSNSSDVGDAAVPELELERDQERDRDLIQRLLEENERLKAFAKQRRTPPPPSRPRTAPPHMQRMLNSTSASTLNVGWRKGAGEELSMFSNAQPRILVPGDTLPFIGVLRDRHGNNRRPLAAGRSRALAGVTKRAASPRERAASPRERAASPRERAASPRERHAPGAGSSGQSRVSGAQLPEASCSLQQDEDTYPHTRDRLQQRPKDALGTESRNGDKSPNALQKQAKEARASARKKDSCRGSSPESSRDMSPDAVLREAKLRLRKLEIEAEAVEQSYRDFRRRQAERRATRAPPEDLAKALDVTRSHSAHQIDETTRHDIETHFADLQKTVRADFDKYILDYKTKFDIGETHFKNKPTVPEKVKPIPDTLAADCTDREVRNKYLEAPLTEFRKLYTSNQQSRQGGAEATTIQSDNNSVTNTEFEYEISARNDALRKVKHNKQAELQILRQNIDKMYHSPNRRDSALTVNQQNNQASVGDENNLRLEVESISEINGIKSQTQDMLLVVQSTVNSRDVMGGEVASEVFSAQMTIIVSPKRPSSPCERNMRSQSPEQAAHLTRNDVLDAIFHADPNDVSSIQMQLALSKDEVSTSEYDKGDYPADFAGAGNYSRSDSERSRISLPVMDGGDMAEDDNFWEV